MDIGRLACDSANSVKQGRNSARRICPHEFVGGHSYVLVRQLRIQVDAFESWAK